MKKLIILSLSAIISFYAGQALAKNGAPCPKNNDRHVKKDAQRLVAAALNSTAPAPKENSNGKKKSI